MSAREATFLKQLGLDYSLIAVCLGLSRQAVTKGIEASRKRDRPYLTATQVSQLFSELKLRDKAELAERFRDGIREVFPELAEGFNRVAIPGIRDQIPTGAASGASPGQPIKGARECWVFTSRPREIWRDGYIASIKDRIFRIKNDDQPTIRRMVYFVPPDISQTLASLIEHALSDIPPDKRNRVLIIESGAVHIVPHFIIVDPRTKPKGLVMGATDEDFAYMTSEQTLGILDYLKKLGIGINKDQLLLHATLRQEPSGADTVALPEFRLCFDSQQMKSEAVT